LCHVSGVCSGTEDRNLPIVTASDVFFFFYIYIYIKKHRYRFKIRNLQKINQKVHFLQGDLTDILTKEISESIHKNAIVRKITRQRSKLQKFLHLNGSTKLWTDAIKEISSMREIIREQGLKKEQEVTNILIKFHEEWQDDLALMFFYLIPNAQFLHCGAQIWEVHKNIECY
jgi:hypothetical protein